jgi:hypothetical protein
LQQWRAAQGVAAAHNFLPSLEKACRERPVEVLNKTSAQSGSQVSDRKIIEGEI